MTAQTDAVELAQRLIRLDTSNPPGREREAVGIVASRLEEAGLEVAVRARDPERPNLVARLRGRGEAPAILMHGHLDVVPAEPERWQRDPFAGEISENVLWGRGAGDMKGMVAMMVSAIIDTARSSLAPPGDVVFAAFSDEECGSSFGARFMVEEHADLFGDVGFAIGEFGAASIELMGRRFYPIQVAEKQWCELRLTIRGVAGHASVPMRGEAMGRLAVLLQTLDQHRLPHRATAPSQRMIEAIAQELPSDAGDGLRMLLDAEQSEQVLSGAGNQLAGFDAMLRNTVTPTRIRASSRFDAIPERIEVDVDGRVLPGSTAEELVGQVSELVGDGVEVELLSADRPPTVNAGDEIPEALVRSLRAVDADAVAVPMLLPGATDGRWLATIGIPHFGFTPLRLPADFPLLQTTHSVDERIPLDALRFGTEVYRRLLAG